MTERFQPSPAIASAAARLPALCLCLAIMAAAPAAADVLHIPDSATSAEYLPLPVRGQTRDSVLRDFGQPLQRHATVAGNRPQHPPITRWDYDGFHVVFEGEHVITAVRPDRPTPVRHKERLDVRSSVSRP